MLYYCKKQARIDDIYTKQLDSLKRFKETVRDKGLQENYISVSDLREKLMRHLTIVMRDINVSPTIDRASIKEAKAATGAKRAAEIESDQTTADTIHLEEYTDRSFVVLGNTVDVKDRLSTEGGKWIKLKTGGGYGWMFSKRHLKKIAQILNLPAELP